MTMDTEREADDLAYAKLEAEMAEGDEEWGSAPSSRDDDDDDDGGDMGGEPMQARERGDADSGGDDDEIERASLEADEIEFSWRERQQYNQPRPDVFDDPIAHLQSLGQELQARQSRDDYQRFLGDVERHENDFKVLRPDYHEAVEVLEKSRRSELARMFPDKSSQAHLQARQNGFRTPAEMRNAIFTQDAQTVARNALAAGINPAKAYYDLSLDRGYKPKPGRSAPSRGGKSGGRGGKSGSFNANMSVGDMADLYAEDAEEFDRQWDRAAKAGALG